ncbi:MAG: trimethylamine methyltransferase family protein, partial [Luminiphilus sp.]
MARRAGGRQARHAQRSAPLEEAMKPVRPGERGGRYHPFTNQDLEAIVENIYRILEEVGFKDATPHCIETCEAVGAVLGDDGRLRMPRAVVDAALKQAKRNLTLHAQDPE